MVDKTDPGVKITLDKERTLLLDLNGMRQYQKVTGKNPLGRQGVDLNDPGDIQAILWASLLREDPSVKLDDVGTWINIENLRAIQLVLIESLGVVFPEVDKKEAEESPLADGNPQPG